jgi:hypothetical protein
MVGVADAGEMEKDEGSSLTASDLRLKSERKLQ